MYVFISSLSTRAATHCLVYAKRISDFRLSIGDDDDDDDECDDVDAGDGFPVFLFLLLPKNEHSDDLNPPRSPHSGAMHTTH